MFDAQFWKDNAPYVVLLAGLVVGLFRSILQRQAKVEAKVEVIEGAMVAQDTVCKARMEGKRDRGSDTMVHKPVDGQPWSLLLVEDNGDDVLLMRRSLRDATASGYHVDLHVVGSALEAESWLASSRPDVILLDLGLPGKDGRQFIRELRSHDSWATIPIVVVTGATPMREQETLKHVDVFLSKPVNLSAVVKMLESGAIQCVHA